MTGTIEGPDIPDLPGYVSIKEAARIMGVNHTRVRQYVKEGRLPGARRLGNQFALPLEEVQKFRSAPAGRVRVKAPEWRLYRSRGKLIATSIQVEIRPEMREKFLTKLKAIKPEKHTFSRNVARYILGRVESKIIEILLVWKDTEMPGDTIQQQDILLFQRDFPELNWDTAQYCNYDVYRHT